MPRYIYVNYIVHNCIINLTHPARLQHGVAHLGQGTQLPAVIRLVLSVRWRLDAYVGIWLGQQLRDVQRIITGSQGAAC